MNESIYFISKNKKPIWQEEEQIEEINEDEIKENMISDIKNNFENQMNTIDAAKVFEITAYLLSIKWFKHYLIKLIRNHYRKH